MNYEPFSFDPCFLGTYEGYAYDMMEEIKKILE